MLCTHPVVAMMTLVRGAAALPAAIRGGEGRGTTLPKLQKNANCQGKGLLLTSFALLQVATRY